MFGIGLPEMILIMALALIVVGPDKLPDLARSIAKGVLELKRTVNTLKEDLAKEDPLASIKPELEDAASSLKKQLGEPGPDGWTGKSSTPESVDPHEQALRDYAAAEEPVAADIGDIGEHDANSVPAPVAAAEDQHDSIDATIAEQAGDLDKDTVATGEQQVHPAETEDKPLSTAS